MVTCTDWTAWYNRMPGTDDRELHVAGKVECESSSIQLSLELDSDGIVDEPDLIALRLTATMPAIGDTQWIVKDVGWSGDVGPDITRVRIQGDCQAEIPVTIAQ